MSIQARRELLLSLRTRYRTASRAQKKAILDEFAQAARYSRKHAIYLLNKADLPNPSAKQHGRKPKYDEPVKSALVTIWRLANEICSKRLIPFLPDFLEALERTGHLQLTDEIKDKLLSLCPATADKLLAVERRKPGGKSTTRSGGLLKRQIPVRTFSDWNDVVPRFFEADLVAHCGSDPSGKFLHSLVLVDIATSWTECIALLQKGEEDVVAGIKRAQKYMPLEILGFDSDNGSEFINHGVITFCRDNQITFTRSRAYKKNDQAHVEERNGSVVRRTIGYDRYEGPKARNALQLLYHTLRLYVNFFQPTMKLISKTRDGVKVSRRYDFAQTPYRRLLSSPLVSDEVKSSLNRTYAKLDPVILLKELEDLQDELWKHAWRNSRATESALIQPLNMRITLLPAAGADEPTAAQIKQTYNSTVKKQSVKVIEKVSTRKYRSTKKQRKKSGRRGRTRKDPFENVAKEIVQHFEQNQRINAKQLLTCLQNDHPGEFADSLKRTLMRRLENLRNSIAGTAVPPPVRKSYPAHINSRTKLTSLQWQSVNGEIIKCFNQNMKLSAKSLFLDLQEKFPHLITEAQIPTLRRRLKGLREGKREVRSSEYNLVTS